MELSGQCHKALFGENMSPFALKESSSDPPELQKGIVFSWVADLE